ncbi:MAG: hypothetical protein ACTSRG_26510 [Candidatus Helarchaeota archaeon]
MTVSIIIKGIQEMKWIKKGLIFDPKDNNSNWIQNYAALPVADLVNENLLRIYFSVRDKKGRSCPTFIEVNPEFPEEIKYIHDKPILNFGELGTFDDNGIMPSWIINHAGNKYLYYIGWNPQKTVSYRLSIGLAYSLDGGVTFTKMAKGPILDRSIDEPFFNTAPCVIKESDLWKMWYVSCTGWKVIKRWPEPFYNVKYAISNDGINWKRTQIICIDYDDFTEAIGKPCVFKEDGKYKMIYSYRNATDYRTNPEKSYRLGYAESEDGISWIRKDSEVGIEFSKDGWDSIMNEYCTTYVHKGKRYLIYNGNGFGESGFGYAVRVI